MITLSNEELKALLGVGAVLFGLSTGGGYTAGRMTAPVPPAPPPIVERVPYIVEVPVPALAPAPEPPNAVEDDPRPAPVPPKVPAVVVPLPRVKGPPPIVAKEKRERPPAKKKVVRKQRRPTASECRQMRSVGRAVVIAGGRVRGHPDAVVEQALRDCGL